MTLKRLKDKYGELMKAKYCDLIKEDIDKKGFKRKEILDSLFESKQKWDYPKVKSLESEEKLIDSNIQQLTSIHNTLLLNCPEKELTEYNIICDLKCKWYYDFLISTGKIELVKPLPGK